MLQGKPLVLSFLTLKIMLIPCIGEITVNEKTVMLSHKALTWFTNDIELQLKDNEV